MYNYEILIYWSEADSCFISEVPELAGCMADGETRMEALQNAEIIINEWLETAKLIGKSIPAAKGKLSYA